MKSIRKTIALAALALSVFASSGAEAATFKIETLVPGYTGYVLVRPELRFVLGGKVRWNSSINAFETDRVARGERLRITIRPSTAGERCHNLAIAGVTSSNGFAAFNFVNLPYVETRFGVSTNTSFDNVMVRTLTSTGYYETRLPIGRR
jgi:hypothetical protein